MNKTERKYIDTTEPTDIETNLSKTGKKYQVSSTGSLGSDERLSAALYMPLPEEYSVFSEVDEKYFLLNDTEQHCFFSQCLSYLRTKLSYLYSNVGVLKVLPKLSMTTDDDAAIVLNWAYTSFRIYFNFEVKVEDSYYGVISRSSEESISTNTGKLTKSNYSVIIDSILYYVLNNS